MQRRFDELEKRVGVAAIVASVDRVGPQEVAFDELSDTELFAYVKSLLEHDVSLLDDVEDEDQRIFREVSTAIGEINGYTLGDIDRGAIHLIKVESNESELVRPYTRITYDVLRGVGNEYEKVHRGRAASGELVQTELPITDDDLQTVDIMLDRLDEQNQKLG